MKLQEVRLRARESRYRGCLSPPRPILDTLLQKPFSILMTFLKQKPTLLLLFRIRTLSQIKALAETISSLMETWHLLILLEFRCSFFPVANCGPLPPPANGDVDTSSGTTAGSVALYSCDQGLVLTGSAARVCGSDGLWTPAPPTCEGAKPYIADLLYCNNFFFLVTINQ